MASDAVLELTDANFDAQVIESDVPVLVDFWAEWCMPCKMLAPVIDEIAEEFAGKIKVGKLDTDNHNQIAMKFGIESVPTLIFFNHGRVVDRTNGVISKSELTDKLKALLRQ